MNMRLSRNQREVQYILHMYIKQKGRWDIVVVPKRDHL